MNAYFAEEETTSELFYPKKSRTEANPNHIMHVKYSPLIYPTDSQNVSTRYY